jgi:hypothetical protein
MDEHRVGLTNIDLKRSNHAPNPEKISRTTSAAAAQVTKPRKLQRFPLLCGTIDSNEISFWNQA